MTACEMRLTNKLLIKNATSTKLPENGDDDVDVDDVDDGGDDDDDEQQEEQRCHCDEEEKERKKGDFLRHTKIGAAGYFVSRWQKSYGGDECKKLPCRSIPGDFEIQDFSSCLRN